MKNKPSIDIDEIREIFRSEYEECGEKFINEDFKKFFQFLKIDLHDWVKENTREFCRQKII